jgi:WD40 repeat protein
MRRIGLFFAAMAIAVGTFAGGQFFVAGNAGEPASAATSSGPRTVMYVGNNWDGTATVVDAASFKKLGRINIIPDFAERMTEIETNPDKLAYFLAIREGVGEGHDQYVDDMFATKDGRLLAVSRPSFADVVGFDMRTREIVWRFPMEGYRADHMQVSNDGTKILVADSTANVVHELDILTGKELRQFPSGDTPHESNYSKDGSKIFHASIGRVYVPTDPQTFCPADDPEKGDMRFQIVDNKTFTILKQWDIAKLLADAGFKCMSGAVRPMAISKDEKTAYLQISFFHGYVALDMVHGRISQIVPLRFTAKARAVPYAQYVLNSAHHGLAINGAGTKLCVAGTMDDYVSIVPIINPGAAKYFPLTADGARPYWSTNGPDDTTCWVSIAGDDRVNIYDYASRTQIGTVTVGDHPQRVRVGVIALSVLKGWASGDYPFVMPDTSGGIPTLPIR